LTNELVKIYTVKVLISSKGGRWIMRIFTIELPALDAALILRLRPSWKQLSFFKLD